MKRKDLLLAVLFLTSLIGCQQKASKETAADAIYTNGDIITMEGDSANYAEAVALKAGKIVFVGSKTEAEKLKGDSTKLIDLQGKTLLPAFLDGHGHFYNVGFAASCANILPPPDGAGKDFASIIAELNRYKDTEDGKLMIQKFGWIIGNGYDDSQLTEKDHPKATDLDKVSTDVPVVIIHQSGHLSAINTKAMNLLGYTKNTKDPKGGTFRRDASGTPNGVLEENAAFAVLFTILAKTDAEMSDKFIQRGQEEYAKKGYLTAQDGRTTVEQMAALKSAADRGLFYLDVVSYPDIALGTECMNDGYYNHEHVYKNKYRIGGVKLTLDGSPQGKTAWLTQCYHVNPVGQKGCYKGYPVMNDAKADEYVEMAFKNKWQILCHTNGDAAIDQYLRAVAGAEAKYAYDDHRTVIIHAQTLRKDQIPTLVKLKILPSLFPMHTYYWGDWHAESVLGEPRADYISPCRDVIDAGLTITSHHDAPVTFPNSMRVMDATVNRVTRSGKILGADQRITPYEALESLTSWAAYQYFEEKSKGTLTVGKLGDLVVLDKNPLKIDPLKIHTIQVLESIKEGKTVYKK
ncbi:MULTISPECIES: amidohydrolase [Sphingobacterium]|uniref:amidohydrolase n=1 Tax=Sphingobacterium TaxID=28453 RepID=UPI0013D92D89|nr:MULTISPECIES: amidohydrolase [unclassified Sphingobacterium]